MRRILENKYIFFSLSFLLCQLLYFPVFHSGPIWDDVTFHFGNELISGDAAFLIKDILLNFNWPISALLQKALYFSFGEEYFFYHAFNFLLHFINSLLFFYFLKINKVKLIHWAYLMYLLHPAMIISVAWMIQVKTLICAFFAILSMIFYCSSHQSEGKKKIKFLIVSFICLLFSLGAKSASLPLIFSLLIITRQRFKITKERLALVGLSLPLLGYLAIRLILSPMTQQGIQQTLDVSPYDSVFSYVLTSVPETLNWYFWHSLIPLESIPVRGPLPLIFAQTFMGLLTMGIFIYLFRKNKNAMAFLLASLAMLLPFLGIIPAPYMTSAWVSEQHLYLVLLFFIPAIAFLIESIPQAVPRIATQVLSLIFIGFISFTNIGNYKDEFHFFKSSFNYNSNLSAGYQLMTYYVKTEQVEEAKNLYFFLLSTIPLEERTLENIFWAQMIQFEPLIWDNQNEEK